MYVRTSAQCVMECVCIVLPQTEHVQELKDALETKETEFIGEKTVSLLCCNLFTETKSLNSCVVELIGVNI